MNVFVSLRWRASSVRSKVTLCSMSFTVIFHGCLSSASSPGSSLVAPIAIVPNSLMTTGEPFFLSLKCSISVPRMMPPPYDVNSYSTVPGTLRSTLRCSGSEFVGAGAGAGVVPGVVPVVPEVVAGGVVPGCAGVVLPAVVGGAGNFAFSSAACLSLIAL